MVGGWQKQRALLVAVPPKTGTNIIQDSGVKWQGNLLVGQPLPPVSFCPRGWQYAIFLTLN